MATEEAALPPSLPLFLLSYLPPSLPLSLLSFSLPPSLPLPSLLRMVPSDSEEPQSLRRVAGQVLSWMRPLAKTTAPAWASDTSHANQNMVREPTRYIH